MIRIPKLGEPPVRNPSWLRKNYPVQPLECWGIVYGEIYDATLPSELKDWPSYDYYNSNPVRAKYFLDGRVYVVSIVNEGKDCVLSDGITIEYAWVGMKPDWLTLSNYPCYCKLQTLMCSGCQCGGS